MGSTILLPASTVHPPIISPLLSPFASFFDLSLFLSLSLSLSYSLFVDPVSFSPPLCLSLSLIILCSACYFLSPTALPRWVYGDQWRSTINYKLKEYQQSRKNDWIEEEEGGRERKSRETDFKKERKREKEREHERAREREIKKI